jgi:NAD(P)H-flavin reductase
MQIKKYLSQVDAIQNPFPGIYTLVLSSLGKPFKFYPGQFLHLAIDSDYDGVGQWPDSRCFSIQSSPDEHTIKITYSAKGNFTKKMEQLLQPQSKVWLKLPYGNLFTQPHHKENCVFIAGGTGITPFLSLFNHTSFDEYINPSIYLGFKSPEFNIYQEELELLRDRTTIFYENEEGQIDVKKIFENHGTESCYFISGPPAMIKSFKTFFLEQNVPATHLLTDDWE